MTYVLRPSQRLACIAVASLLVGSLHAQRASTKEIAAAATPAAVTILAIDATGDTISQGSGFFVSASGLLLTNWHVLRGATRAIVFRTVGPHYERVAFVGGDSLLDLAVLKVPGYGLPFLRTRQTSPSVGEGVTVIGSPLGFPATVSTGIVSALRSERGNEMVQISAPISPGSSGGPVLDASGLAFAVATSRARGGEQMNFAVPVRLATSWLAGSPSERSIASVFGAPATARGRDGAVDVSPKPAAPRRTTLARSTWEPLPIPRRSAYASRAISGVFDVSIELYWDSLGARVRRQGLLVANEAQGGFGLMVVGRAQISPQDTGLAPFEVSMLRSLRRFDDGRVVFDDYSNPMSGYRTRDGFFLSGSGRDADGDHYVLRTHLTETSVELSKNYGLYEATWISRYRSDTASYPSAGTLAWSGGVAVVTLNDSIYVSVALRNTIGGTTVFEAHNVFSSDGEFDLVHRNGSRLKGSVHAGTLVAEFHDQRDHAFFTGTLRATRK